MQLFPPARRLFCKVHPTVPLREQKRGTAEMKRKAAYRIGGAAANGGSSSLTVNNEGREGKGKGRWREGE